MCSGGETRTRWKPSAGELRRRCISCSGSGIPERPQIALLTMEKIAVLAPMPSASVSTATAVNPGARRSIRHEDPDVLEKRFPVAVCLSRHRDSPIRAPVALRSAAAERTRLC